MHRVSLPGPGSVNSYWIETPSGAVIIDAQRRRTAARTMLREIEDRDLEILAILLTHAHPDHVGGADALITAAPPQARVMATGGTLEALADDPGGYLALARQLLGDDFGGRLPGVRRLGSQEGFEVGGIEFQTREIGPGEAPNMTLYYPTESNALFCGDLVANGMTPFLFEGRTAEWIEQLKRLRSRYPRVRLLYPGHGAPGPVDALVETQIEYLERFRERVQTTLEDDGRMSPSERAGVIAATQGDYPGYLRVAELDDLIGLNADEVSAEILGRFWPGLGRRADI